MTPRGFARKLEDLARSIRSGRVVPIAMTFERGVDDAGESFQDLKVTTTGRRRRARGSKR